MYENAVQLFDPILDFGVNLLIMKRKSEEANLSKWSSRQSAWYLMFINVKQET